MLISELVHTRPVSASAPVSPRFRQQQDETLLTSISVEQRRVVAAVGEVQQDVSEILRLLREDGTSLHRANRCTMPAAEAERYDWSYNGQRHHSTGSYAKANGRSSHIELNPEVGRMSALRDLAFDPHRGSEVSSKSLAEEQKLRAQHALPSLPYSWPRGLKIREGLEREHGGTEKSLNTTSTERNVLNLPAGWENLTAHRRSTFFMDDVQRASLFGKLLSRCITDPCSWKRITFDALSYLLLMFTLLVIPYMLAFHCIPPGPVVAACYFASSWWTAALALNFLTGYYSNGELVMIPCQVMKRYLSSWFVPEVTLVVIDWANVSRLSSSKPLLRSGYLARVFWLLNALRAWKMMRAASDIIIEANFRDQIRSALTLLLFITAGICLNHWVACMWIWIGHAAKNGQSDAWPQRNTNDEYQWFIKEEFGETCRIDRDVVYLYMTALHWSVAQFTLSGMDIVCANSLERFFTVLCQVFGMLAGSTLVSVIAAKMVDWQMMRKDHINSIRQLQLFLEQQNVQRQTAVKVRRQVRDRQRHAERLTEDDVPALKFVSSSLLQDLRCEIFRPYVFTHPLFRLWASLDCLVVTRLCSDTIDLTVQRKNDHLFQTGFHAEDVFFLVCGQLSYVQAPGFFEGEAKPVIVDKDAWLCEAALWLHWIHVGKAEAMMGSQTLRLSAEGVVRALDSHHLVQKVSREYCHQFHKRLTSAFPPSASFPNDLQVPFTDYTDIVLSMKHSIQVTVGLHALNVASAQVSRPWHVARGRPSLQLELLKLKHEIVNGESTVMLNSQGALERVVSVVALRIEREDGCILCQLWKMLNQHCEPEACCQMPGGKQKAGETSGDAVRRILSTKLSPLQLAVEVGKSVCQPEWKDSKMYGVRTKYMRTETCCNMRTSALAEGVIQNESMGMTSQNSQDTKVSNELEKEESLQSVEGIDLLGRQVALMRDKHAKVYYAWLTPSEFEYFGTSNGETELTECIPELKRRGDFISV